MLVTGSLVSAPAGSGIQGNEEMLCLQHEGGAPDTRQQGEVVTA